MAVSVVTNDNFETEVLKSDKPVLVDFWATWCGPCKMLSPLVHQFAEENPDVKVCSVDVDEAQELAAQFQVASIPTLIVFKDGQPVNRALGFMPKEKIAELVK